MVRITPEENKKVHELVDCASNMPVITFSCGQPSFAELAWDDVRNYMQELADKYGYDASSMAIDGDGEVIPAPLE